MRLTTRTGGSMAIVAVQAAWLHSPLPTPLRVLASIGGRFSERGLQEAAGLQGRLRRDGDDRRGQHWWCGDRKVIIASFSGFFA